MEGMVFVCVCVFVEVYMYVFLFVCACVWMYDSVYVCLGLAITLGNLYAIIQYLGHS